MDAKKRRKKKVGDQTKKEEREEREREKKSGFRGGEKKNSPLSHTIEEFLSFTFFRLRVRTFT